MIAKRWFLPVLTFVFLAMLISSCGSTEDTPEPPTATVEPTPVEPTAEPSAPAGTPSPPSGAELALQYIVRLEGATLARVNGEEITWEDYEPGLRQALVVINQQHQVDWSDAAMQQRLRFLQNDVLKQTVDRWLMRQVAAEQGITVDEAELEAQVENEKSQVLNSGQYADWDSFLQKNGLTDRSFRQLIHDTLLLNALMAEQKVESQGEQAHVRHIVVPDEATAQKVVAALKAGGDFAELAAQYSQDEQTKNSGGDLGWISEGLMTPEISRIAASLGPGEFSDPIAMQQGYAIIQIVERGIHEFDSRTIMQKQQQAVMNQVEEAKTRADIEYLVDFTTVEGESP